MATRHVTLAGAAAAGLLATAYAMPSRGETSLPADAPVEHREAAWSNTTALTIAQGRVELSVLSEASWGVTARVELRLHPLLFLALPHAEAKVRWLSCGPFFVSSVHRLAYPTPFLSLVSREGSGGLLPATTDNAHSIIVESDALGSAEWFPEHWVSARAGLSLAISGSGDKTLMDFPFLYQRLAALNAPAVPRVALSASGRWGRWVGYELELRHYWLPLDDSPLFHVDELAVSGFILLGPNHRLEAAARVSVADLPVGTRTHWFPHLDYRIAF